MIEKILVFASWLTSGISAVSFISLVCRFSPGLRVPVLLLLGAALLFCLIVSFFAPSARPWVALISAVVFVGGLFVWLA